MEAFVIFVIVLALCGWVGCWVGSQKGRGVAGFWLGLAAGPLGWIVVAVLPAPPAKPKPQNLVRVKMAESDPVDAWERSQAGPPPPRAGWRDRLQEDEQ